MQLKQVVAGLQATPEPRGSLQQQQQQQESNRAVSAAAVHWQVKLLACMPVSDRPQLASLAAVVTMQHAAAPHATLSLHCQPAASLHYVSASAHTHV
jgi:hypothetical protein